MQASNRIIVNTLVQYVRTIINVLLSLYSSRLVLNILGVEDYGIYALVGGVVSMLSFITNSLVSSTQRFLSVYQGRNNKEKLKEVFSNSLLLHILLGLIVAIILELLTPLLFHGFLNIPQGRESAASIIYQQVVIMVYVSFIAAPYRALLVSRENIVYISFIDILDGIFKVVFVLLLSFVSFDKLIAYGFSMLIIRFLNLLAFAIYSHLKYTECVFPKIKYFSKVYVKELFSYTGWVVYSSACISFRVQGLAIILNKFYGSIVNAAYGIGGQISGMVSFISSSFNNAISPQLMAAEGSGNRSHMILLAKIESKFSFLLLSLIGIPTMFEMQSLLELWLVDVPSYTMLFGCMFLAMQIVDMLTIGLGTANRAIGKIGMFTVLTYTPKLIVIPLCIIMLNLKKSLIGVAIIMISIECICMLLRIPLLKNIKEFVILDYVKDVILKCIIPVIINVICCSCICYFFQFYLRFIITYIVAVPITMVVIYYVSLSKSEQRKILSIKDSIINRIKIHFNKYR